METNETQTKILSSLWEIVLAS